MQVDELPTTMDVLRLAGTMTRLARILDHQVRGAGGLSVAELGVLAQIHHGNDLPSAVARELYLDAPRVSRVTDRLVNLEYVQRRADVSDRRMCRLSLTEAGEARLAEGRADVVRAMNTLLHGLTDDERQGLEMGLDAVRRSLHDSGGNR